MRTLWRVLWCLVWLYMCLAWASSLSAMGSEEYANAFEREIRAIVARAPRYTWGGARDERLGLDCSGYIYLAARRAGIPGISRTTALRMALGCDGWFSDPIRLRDARHLDLVWWTWEHSRATRPHGHVGIILLGDHSGLLEVTHASQRRGVVVEPLTGYLMDCVSEARRLKVLQ